MCKIEQRRQEICQKLDEYEKNIGLPTMQNPCQNDEIEQYFTMDRKTIELLSKEDCGQISYRLLQYGLYIQRLTNRISAESKWIHANLNDIIGQHANDFDKYTKHEVKCALIRKSNETAHKLSSIIINNEQKLERLKYITNMITNLSDNLRGQSYGKKNMG